MTYKTEQEEFWASEFGDGYISRNNTEKLIVSRMIHFARFMKTASNIKSIMELGCNIGLNLQALNRLDKNLKLSAFEINPTAAEEANALGIADITCGTIINSIEPKTQYDLTFTSGVLMHIDPQNLGGVYQNLYDLSNRYILVNEYYNPTPVMVEYRGVKDRLFKRDFAGELIDKYNLRLVDYGFLYHRDNYFPRDDATWFLLEK